MRSPPRASTVDGVELSFSDLSNDALYAIKKGAAKVSKAVLSWDKISTGG